MNRYALCMSVKNVYLIWVRNVKNNNPSKHTVIQLALGNKPWIDINEKLWNSMNKSVCSVRPHWSARSRHYHERRALIYRQQKGNNWNLHSFVSQTMLHWTCQCKQNVKLSRESYDIRYFKYQEGIKYENEIEFIPRFHISN